jgi:hypothetical protein
LKLIRSGFSLSNRLVLADFLGFVPGVTDSTRLSQWLCR